MRGRFAVAATAVTVLCAAIGLGCSVNLLENFASKTTNEALFEDAKKDINAGDYDSALAKFNLMTGGYLTDRHVILWKATAYAGKCGLKTLHLVEDIGTTSARLFPFLVHEFKGASGTRIDSCVAAEALIESIGVSGVRTADENLLQAAIGFAKMGNVLNFYTDGDQDGVADPTADPCVHVRGARPAAAVTGDFYDGDLREFGTGLTQVLINMNAIASQTKFSFAALANVSALCGTLPHDFCAIVDPTAFINTDLQGIRSLINESNLVGLGTTCTGDPVPGQCLCSLP